jgi:hypothetical protein
MAKSFGDAHGEAKKNNLDYIKLEMGENRVRIVGDLLPRYAYWKEFTQDENKFNVPIECLGFDRDKEEFTNVEQDWFRHYFPKEKCSWSYVIHAFDKDGELKLFGLKKKLFEQIQAAAETLGDPTDVDKGYWLVIRKKKNGPLPFNIEYELLQLKLQPEPLSDELKEKLKQMRPIDEVIPRPTPEQQKEFIERAWFSDTESNVDEDAVDDLDATGTDDVPF